MTYNEEKNWLIGTKTTNIQIPQTEQTRTLK